MWDRVALQFWLADVALPIVVIASSTVRSMWKPIVPSVYSRSLCLKTFCSFLPPKILNDNKLGLACLLSSHLLSSPLKLPNTVCLLPLFVLSNDRSFDFRQLSFCVQVVMLCAGSLFVLPLFSLFWLKGVVLLFLLRFSYVLPMFPVLYSDAEMYVHPHSVRSCRWSAQYEYDIILVPTKSLKQCSLLQAWEAKTDLLYIGVEYGL